MNISYDDRHQNALLLLQWTFQNRGRKLIFWNLWICFVFTQTTGAEEVAHHKFRAILFSYWKLLFMFYCHKENGELFVRMSFAETFLRSKYDLVDRTSSTAMVYNKYNIDVWARAPVYLTKSLRFYLTPYSIPESSSPPRKTSCQQKNLVSLFMMWLALFSLKHLCCQRASRKCLHME